MQYPFEHMPEHARASESAYAPSMLKNAPRNAHTYIQTYKHLPTLLDHLALRNARRGVARRSPQSGGKTCRPAALRAGLGVGNHA